jgi:hypothetical protein
VPAREPTLSQPCLPSPAALALPPLPQPTGERVRGRRGRQSFLPVHAERDEDQRVLRVGRWPGAGVAVQGLAGGGV